MAYLTASELKDESAWYFTIWQPVHASETELDTWLGTIVTRVARHTEWRVGSTLYSGATALQQAILKEAELCLGQYYVILAVAAIADSSDAPEENRPVNSGDRLRRDAREYHAQYLRILETLGSAGLSGRATPAVSVVGEAAPAAVPGLEAAVDWERP